MQIVIINQDGAYTISTADVEIVGSGTQTAITQPQQIVIISNDGAYTIALSDTVAPEQPDTNAPITSNYTSIPTSFGVLETVSGNDKYVTVIKNSNIALVSSDAGSTWSQVILPFSADWTGIKFGNGTFVVIAPGNKVAVSTDGIAFTEKTLPITAQWSGLAFGSGKFLAVSNGKATVYSSNGSEWSAGALNSIGNWIAPKYANNVFVTVSRNSNVASYSSNGINWQESTLPFAASWDALFYAENRFIATSYGLSKVAISNDAQSWSSVSILQPIYRRYVFSSPDVYVELNPFLYGNNDLSLIGNTFEINVKPAKLNAAIIQVNEGLFISDVASALLDVSANISGIGTFSANAQYLLSAETAVPESMLFSTNVAHAILDAQIENQVFGYFSTDTAPALFHATVLGNNENIFAGNILPASLEANLVSTEVSIFESDISSALLEAASFSDEFGWFNQSVSPAELMASMIPPGSAIFDSFVAPAWFDAWLYELPDEYGEFASDVSPVLLSSEGIISQISSFNKSVAPALLAASIDSGLQFNAQAAPAILNASNVQANTIAFEADIAPSLLEAILTNIEFSAFIAPALLGAAAVSSQSGTFDKEVAPAILSASSIGSLVSQTNITVKPAKLLATNVPDVANTFDATVQPAEFIGLTVSGQVCSFEANAAVAIFEATGPQEALVLAANLIVNPALLTAVLVSPSTNKTEVWLVNTKNLKHRTYSALPFNSYTQYGDKVLAAGADGIYTLDAEYDNDDPITGVITGELETGLTDFGMSSVKFINDLRVSCEGEGDFTVTTVSDSGIARDYEQAIDHKGLWQNRRVRLARGLKSRFCGVRLLINSGVSIESVEVMPQETRRSV